MWILSIWKLIKLPHNRWYLRWYLLLLTSTCILIGHWEFQHQCCVQIMFYRGGNFPGISRETKYWCFFFIPTMKTAVIEFLLSVDISTIFEMEYVWTKEETFVTLFLLLRNAALLLAKKSDCFRYILKGDIYHQISNCIKSRIVNVYGLWSIVWLPIFSQGRNWQKFCNSQFLMAVAWN